MSGATLLVVALCSAVSLVAVFSSSWAWTVTTLVTASPTFWVSVVVKVKVNDAPEASEIGRASCRERAEMRGGGSTWALRDDSGGGERTSRVVAAAEGAGV